MFQSTSSDCLFLWFVCAAAALPFIIMTIVYKPYQRGVYCDDQSIMYPVKADTITHGMLAAVTISCTVIIVSRRSDPFFLSTGKQRYYGLPQ